MYRLAVLLSLYLIFLVWALDRDASVAQLDVSQPDAAQEYGMESTKAKKLLVFDVVEAEAAVNIIPAAAGNQRRLINDRGAVRTAVLNERDSSANAENRLPTDDAGAFGVLGIGIFGLFVVLRQKFRELR
jgi:hypothetical protein